MDDTKSQARKIRWVFKKYKKLIKKYYETSNFKEPILILMRRNGKATFFENATKGQFDYEHSDGTTRFLMLTPEKRQTFEYGQKEFKGYICHEDHPLPLPEEPLITTEMFGLAIEKTLNDIKKWKAEEVRAKSEYIRSIGTVIAITLGLFILYKLVIVPPSTSAPTSIIPTIIGGTTTAIKNATLKIP